MIGSIYAIYLPSYIDHKHQPFHVGTFTMDQMVRVVPFEVEQLHTHPKITCPLKNDAWEDLCPFLGRWAHCFKGHEFATFLGGDDIAAIFPGCWVVNPIWEISRKHSTAVHTERGSRRDVFFLSNKSAPFFFSLTNEF